MNVHVKARVLADEVGLPGNRHHCAIANAIMLADSDIVHVRVDEDHIRFSRRSTGDRYDFATPAKAAAFIREFDKLIAAEDGGKVRQMTARGFTLELTDRQLIRATPRKQRDAARVIRATAVKAFGPAFVEASAAKTKTAVNPTPAKATAAAAEQPKRTIRVAAPRRRPSQRV